MLIRVLGRASTTTRRHPRSSTEPDASRAGMLLRMVIGVPGTTNTRDRNQIIPRGSRGCRSRRVRRLGLLRVERLVAGQHGNELADLALAGLRPFDNMEALDEGETVASG